MAKKYKPIPVDIETHEMVEKIARSLGFGERGLGAVVRRLAKEEYAKLLAGQLVSGGQSAVPPAAPAPGEPETG